MRPGGSPTVRCRGCGAEVPDTTGPTHRYMLSAPACFEMFGRLRSGDMPTTQLLVDCYAVQHPGVPCPPANQSVCIHLLNLARVLEDGGRAADGPAFLGRLSHRAYPWFTPPTVPYPVTVAELVRETAPATYRERERECAELTWRAWSEHHPTLRAWLHDPSTLPPPR